MSFSIARRTATHPMSASRPSPIKAASMSLPCRRTRAPTSTCRRRRSATGAGCSSPTRADAPTSSPSSTASASPCRRDDPRIARLLDEVKEREAKGYAYEAADASFELLARRMLGNVPQFFDVESFRVMVERRHNAVGDLVTVSEATVKVRIDGETMLSVGEGQRPGERARHGAAQGSRPLSELYLRPRARRLQGAYPHGRHRRRDAGFDREPGRGGEPLVHRRRVAEHRRCLLRGAARFHQLQADPRRRDRASNRTLRTSR